MSITNIAGFIKGYMIIYAEGFFCERFLNICMRRGIYLWNVRRMGENRICACISIQGFREIRQVARKTRTHITVSRRYGLPFLLHRYRKRKTVLVGIALFFVLLWYLSTHIMGIDVVGNERIDSAEIVSELKNFGIYHGAAVRKIDEKLVKNQMMTRFDDIAWIGVNIKGSRAYIEVRERLDTHVEVDRDMPCDIVAAKQGLVRLLEVKNGQTMVKTGQMVEAGDLLVSGVVDSEKKGMRYVHSFGEIFAETVYKKTREYPFRYTEKIYTGEEKLRHSVSVLGKEFKLFLKDTQPFEYCDKIEESTEYRAPVSFIPSVFVDSSKYLEYTPKEHVRTPDETVEFGKNELSAELEKEVPQSAEILDVKVSYLPVGDKGVSVTVEYLCREDIGVQRPIDKIENLNYDIIEKE